MSWYTDILCIHAREAEKYHAPPLPPPNSNQVILGLAVWARFIDFGRGQILPSPSFML